MSGSPLIIGHRGDSSHAPENTLAALRMAVDKGADGVEFDVRLASDNIPVVIHDATLERTARFAGSVSDLTSAQLGEIDVGSWFNRRFPAFADPKYSNEGVRTLSDVLEQLRGFGGLIYVELKSESHDSDVLARAVCDLIRDSPQLPRIIVKSFRLSTIAKVRCELPEVQTAALFAPKIMHFLRRKKQIVPLAHEIGAHQLSLHRSLAGRGLLRNAAEARMPVTLWTVNADKWVRIGRELDVKALITNDPARMIAERTALDDVDEPGNP